MVRNGNFPSAPNYKPKKIIHVGHSYGSGQTYVLANMVPSVSDGIVLTGFGTNGSFLPLFLAGGDFQQARERYPDRFAKLPSGYLISGSAAADQYLFLQQDRVDPKLAAMGEQTKEPVTIGQLLTVGSLPKVNNFKGPVLILTGETDLPFCGGDCLRTGDPAVASIPAQSKKAFPNVATKDFLAYIQPQTQHGITFHFNQTGSAAVIQRFLKVHGL